MVGELGLDGKSVRMIDSGRSSTSVGASPASPAALVAVTDGTTVAVHLVSDEGGEGEGVSTVVAVTREKRMDSSKANDNEHGDGAGIVSFAPYHFFHYPKQLVTTETSTSRTRTGMRSLYVLPR